MDIPTKKDSSLLQPYEGFKTKRKLKLPRGLSGSHGCLVQASAPGALNRRAFFRAVQDLGGGWVGAGLEASTNNRNTIVILIRIRTLIVIDTTVPKLSWCSGLLSHCYQVTPRAMFVFLRFMHRGLRVALLQGVDRASIGGPQGLYYPLEGVCCAFEARSASLGFLW